MLNKNKFKLFFVLGLSATLLLGCSSVQKANIPETADPRQEFSKLNEDVQTAVTKNIDVLAANDFRQSKDYLVEAKNRIDNGKPKSEVLDAIRISKGYLNQAYSVAGNNESKAEGLFTARQMTLQAGAASFPELKDDLEDLDSDVSDKASELTSTDVDKLAEYQSRYVELEKKAVVLSQLGKSQKAVDNARKNGALKMAPISFKKAELSLKTAESMISTNVRNPEGYQPAVTAARRDAQQLLNVMTTIDQNGKDLAESVAIKMVAQNKTISGLETNLDQATANSVADKSTIRVQQAIEKARTQFSSSEAEAMQQGKNLVIRLKQMNFATGSSDLPSDALPLLAKVSSVAKFLNAAQIKVEGHTDSVGADAKNKTLSESRANAVATYFKSNGFSDISVESEGYGYRKPIATNKSKAGRSQNRRVDIVISPTTIVN